MPLRSRRFFSVLWRANAVLIFVAGIMGSLVLAFVLFLMWQEATRSRHASDVLNVASNEIEGSTTSLGGFDPIEGTPVLRAELFIEQEYEFSAGSKDTRSTQNYLYYNPTENTTNWLLPGYKGIILATHELPADDYREVRTPPKVVLYELVDRDTNGDGKLTQNDRRDIAVSDPAGTRLTRVLKDVEGFNGGHLAEGGADVLVFYRSAGALHVARIDSVTGKVLHESDIRTSE
jgi:hypothetical protein